MLKRKIFGIAILIGICCDVSVAAGLNEFDLNTAVEVATLIESVESSRQNVESTILILRQPNAAAQIGASGSVRDAAKAAIKEFAEPLITKALTNRSIANFIALSTDLNAVQAQLKALREKLESTQQQVQITQNELSNLKSSIEPYTELSSNKGRLAFVKNELAKALAKPIEVNLGGESIKVEIVGGTDGLFQSPSTLTLDIHYQGGLTVRAKGVSLNNSQPFLSFGADVSMNSSSISGAAQSFLGEVLKELDLPLPMTIEDVQIDETSVGSNAPRLVLSVSAQIPGLEGFVDLLEMGGGKIKASFVLSPGVKSIKDAIKYNDDVELKFPPGSAPKVPLGSGLQYVSEKLSFKNKNAQGQIENELKVFGTIGPMPAANPGEGIALSVDIALKLAGRPKITLTGGFLALGERVGDFECTITSNEVNGTVTFPAKGGASAALAAVYRGNFSFKLTPDGLSAEGITVLYSVLRGNFALFLSLNGRSASSFSSNERLALGAIDAASTLRATLSPGYRDLRMDIALWCEVDLLVYKPTARVDIAAAMTDLPAKAAAGRLNEFETLSVKASALGVSVSWSPQVKQLSEVRLSEIEERLRKQLDNMLNRLSSAAADWEKDKRDLLARWEGHWSKTLSDEARKFGVDKIDTGVPELNSLLGDVADTTKQAGGWLSKAGKGMGGAWSNGRQSAGNAYNRARDTIKGWGLGANVRQRQNVRFASLQPPPEPETPDDIVSDFFRSWQGLTYGARPPSGNSPGTVPNSARNLELIARPIRTKFTDIQELRELGKIFKEEFGSTDFGTKLERAIVDGVNDAVSDSEALAFALAVQSSGGWLRAKGDGPVEPSPQLSFEQFAEHLDRIDILRERVEGDRVRQIHISFDDSAVERDPQQNVTIGTIVRVAGVVRAGNRQLSASNLIPVAIVLRPIARKGDAYIAELQVPDVNVLTEQQFKWMALEEPRDQTTDGVADPAEYDGFDRSILGSGDEAQQRAKVQEFLTSVFVGNNVEPTSGVALDANGIVQLALQAAIEKLLPQTVSIASKRFQHERRIAVRNMTSEALDVRVKARSRIVANAAFAWTWQPSMPIAGPSFEYDVPSGPNAVLEFTVDTGDQPDDFGAVRPPLVGSRMRIDIRSEAGERWNFSDQDIFLVDRVPELGGERVYEGASLDVFTFTVQSSRVPPARRVTLFQSNRVQVEHRGDALMDFDVPVSDVNVADMIAGLRVKRVKRSTATGEVEGESEEDWIATIPSEALDRSLAGNSSPPAHTSRIRVSLVPEAPEQRTSPGRVAPTQEVVVTYEQESPPWKAGYRLELGKGTPSSALTGWLLFENRTGVDWKGVDVELRSLLQDNAQAGAISLSGVTLQRRNARLALQKPIPLSATIDPVLIYDPRKDCCHPLRNSLVSLLPNAPRSLPAGDVIIVSNGAPNAKVPFEGVEPGASREFAFPAETELGVCVERNDRTPLIQHVGVCLRHGCFEYRDLARTIFFNVNHSIEFSKRQTTMIMRLPAEPGWSETDFSAKIAAVPAIQEIAVEQSANAAACRKLNLLHATLKELEGVSLTNADPFAPMLALAIELRKKNDRKALGELLGRADLIIESVELVCAPIKVGMIPELSVKVRNVGGCAGNFSLGQSIVSADRFPSTTANDRTIIDPCKSATFRLRASASFPTGATINVVVDPDNLIAESFEDNNERKFRLDIERN